MDIDPTLPILTAEAEIYIVGLGIVQVDQITRESEDALRSSNEVLFVARGGATEQYLRSVCRKVTDLTSLYEENADRQNTYRLMAARVIQSALANPPVTLALYGHPLVFAYPPFLVRTMAQLLGLTIKIFPGISAMDCMLVDLVIDPATNGLQMYEATDLLLRERPLQPDVPAMIWQIGALETALFATGPSVPERFDRFVRHLLKFYPESHEVYATYSATHPLFKSEIYKFALRDMGKYAANLHQGFSLFIPILSTRPIVDIQLAKDAVDVNHLSKILLPSSTGEIGN